MLQKENGLLFDTDDWWTFDKLEVCLNNVNENVDFIYHKLEINYDNSNSFLQNKKNS